MKFVCYRTGQIWQSNVRNTLISILFVFTVCLRNKYACSINNIVRAFSSLLIYGFPFHMFYFPLIPFIPYFLWIACPPPFSNPLSCSLLIFIFISYHSLFVSSRHFSTIYLPVCFTSPLWSFHHLTSPHSYFFASFSHHLNSLHSLSCLIYSSYSHHSTWFIFHLMIESQLLLSFLNKKLSS